MPSEYIKDNSEHTPVFMYDDMNGLIGYDLYLRLADRYKMLPQDLISDTEALSEVLMMTEAEPMKTASGIMEFAMPGRLSDIIKLMNAADMVRLRKSLGVHLDYGISQENLLAITGDMSVDLLEVPVTREELYLRLSKMKMSSYMAFRLVRELSTGAGLSEDMRDELWMVFSPDWLTYYCERIKYMPGDYELDQQTKMLLTIGWWRARERADFEAGRTECV